MYSPMIPRNIIWTAEKKNIPQTTGAIPKEKFCQKISLYIKYTQPIKKLTRATPSPKNVATRNGTLD